MGGVSVPDGLRAEMHRRNLVFIGNPYPNDNVLGTRAAYLVWKKPK